MDPTNLKKYLKSSILVLAEKLIIKIGQQHLDFFWSEISQFVKIFQNPQFWSIFDSFEFVIVLCIQQAKQNEAYNQKRERERGEQKEAIWFLTTWRISCCFCVYSCLLWIASWKCVEIVMEIFLLESFETTFSCWFANGVFF